MSVGLNGERAYDEMANGEEKMILVTSTNGARLVSLVLSTVS